MGVTGLTSYVDRENLLQIIEISPTSPQKMVIDGASLSYHISEGKIDWRIGQYSKFKNLLVSFINDLQKCGVIIEAFVFDSARANPLKRTTRIKRDTQNIALAGKYLKTRAIHEYIKLNDDQSPPQGILPFLTHYVSINTLKSLNLKVIIAKEEADKVLASYAEATDSCVLGNDSDYMIYPISKGYIPLKSITIIGKTIHALYYQKDQLTQHLRLHESLLPLLPCLLGCDYIPLHTLKTELFFSKFSLQNSNTENILRFIAYLPTQSTNLQTVFQAIFDFFNLPNKSEARVYLETQFKKIFQEYTLDLKVVDGPSTPHPNDPNGLLTDPMLFKVFFCPVILESHGSPTLWNHSALLRLLAYQKWIGNDPIEEYGRENKDYVKSMVYPETLQSKFKDVESHIPQKRLLDDTYLLHYTSLLQRVLRFLVDFHLISKKELVAIVSAIHCPVGDDALLKERLYAPVSHSTLLGLLETTLVSGAMYWSKPICSEETVDGPSLFYYLNLLDCKEGESISSKFCSLKISPELSKQVLSYLKETLKP